MTLWIRFDSSFDSRFKSPEEAGEAVRQQEHDQDDDQPEDDVLAMRGADQGHVRSHRGQQADEDGSDDDSQSERGLRPRADQDLEREQHAELAGLREAVGDEHEQRAGDARERRGHTNASVL